MNENEKIEFQFELELKSLVAELDSHLNVYTEHTAYIPRAIFDYVKEKSLFSSRLKKSSSHRVYAARSEDIKSLGYLAGRKKTYFTSHLVYRLIHQVCIYGRQNREFVYGYCYVAEILKESVNTVGMLNKFIRTLDDLMFNKEFYDYEHKFMNLINIEYMFNLMTKGTGEDFFRFIYNQNRVGENSLRETEQNLKKIYYGNFASKKWFICLVSEDYGVLICQKNEDKSLSSFFDFMPKPSTVDFYKRKAADDSPIIIDDFEIHLNLDGMQLIEMYADSKMQIVDVPSLYRIFQKMADKCDADDERLSRM